MAVVSSVLSSAEQVPSDLPVDRLSSLPSNILDIILGKLSITEAARTCVLAKDWQYKWLCISDFSIDYELISPASGAANRWNALACIINRFLLHHSLSIRKFYLKAYCRPRYSAIYPWLQHLLTRDVEVLSIEELGYKQNFEMPSYLFLFEKLQCLFLKRCALQFPSTCRGFNSLRELSFCNVLINDDELHRLILECPLLVKLKLFEMSRLEHLRISSPLLEELEIDNTIGDIMIKDSACLVSVCISDNSYSDRMMQNWRSVTCSLSSLDILQTLVLFRNFIEILAADYALETYPLRNDTLSCLSLFNLRFETLNVFRVCLSLLSSCSNIKSFQFTVEAAKGPKLITAFLMENHGRFSFPQLDSILVTSPAGMGCTVNFLEFLCAHSPNLKALTIKKGGKHEMNATRVSNVLSRLTKLSPQASIQYQP
ncbi:F-box protein At3g03040-like [Chenopodium quinoa]|uniref:F-box/LRR-repeat protein 15/At3g58940/PEG3-like LRR domain-containing protein n=1 Tax=Chenopodium quinoa TaxID=63459 RepID=A0A803LC48_CHEQI|nr:F-box protein At3g03040-like [Chenopodium quinoa]